MEIMWKRKNVVLEARVEWTVSLFEAWRGWEAHGKMKNNLKFDLFDKNKSEPENTH